MVADRSVTVNPLFLRDEALREGIELLFLATRDGHLHAAAPVAAHGLGAAHQRALYVIARSPGITIGRLLSWLSVTKQSLGRVLRDLEGAGLLTIAPGRNDRRTRCLTLTQAGAALEASATRPLRERMAQAYRLAGPGAVEGFTRVLTHLLEPEDQALMDGMRGGHRDG